MFIKRLFLIFFFSHMCCAAPLYSFDSLAQQQQFEALTHELRCLVCQNQDLADSHASLANDLRDEVYRHVRMGESNKQIINFLTARYGDFILFKPPMKASTLLLWGGPFLFFLIGLCIFWRSMRHD